MWALRTYLSTLLPQGSLVEDCLQEVAAVAWKKAPKDKTQRDFLAYCLACAKRIDLASIQKNKLGRLHLLAPDVALALTDTVRRQEEEQAEPDQRIPALRQCLDGLDPRQRRLLEARYGDGGRGVGEEAKRLERSLDCLYKQLERLRSALRACVARQLGKEA